VPVDPATLVLAHRGASAHRPENTIAAFVHAAELGADGVELDVRPTADGALAVLHDALLTDGRALAEVAADDLPESVPLLAAALAACTDLLVNIEIKSDEPGAGVALVAAVATAAGLWGGRVLVSSFDPETVDVAAGAGLPSAQLTFLPDRPVPELVAWIAGRGLVAWHPHHLTVDEAAVASAHAAGLAVNTWTVDDPARVAELAGWGVDAVVTNDVPTAVAALGRDDRPPILPS
jgi:glycerophosphoryl diester phosphodiesterase